MRRELFTPVGDRGQRNARVRARLGALAVSTALGTVVSISAALPASATRAGDGRPGDSHAPVVVSCGVVTATVVGRTATFTVGPRGCDGQTPPLSFSTYTLKNGLVQPYTSQVAFAHAVGNGTSYGAGTYTLVAALPECNWQSDLYLGQSQLSAPHIHPISGMNVGWDFQEGRVCAPAVSPSPSASPSESPSAVPSASPSASPSESPSAVPSASPSASPSESPSAVPSESPSAVPSASPSASPSPSESPSASPSGAPSASPTPAPGVTPSVAPIATPPATVEVAAAPSASPTTRSEVLSAGPTNPSPSPSTTYVSEVLAAKANLAATGATTGPVLGGAAVLLLAGGLLVMLRRRSGQRS